MRVIAFIEDEQGGYGLSGRTGRRRDAGTGGDFKNQTED